MRAFFLSSLCLFCFCFFFLRNIGCCCCCCCCCYWLVMDYEDRQGGGVLFTLVIFFGCLTVFQRYLVILMSNLDPVKEENAPALHLLHVSFTPFKSGSVIIGSPSGRSPGLSGSSLATCSYKAVLTLTFLAQCWLPWEPAVKGTVMKPTPISSPNEGWPVYLPLLSSPLAKGEKCD